MKFPIGIRKTIVNNKVTIEKIGLIGIVLTAITSPCCFPLFGVLVSSLGYSSFELFGNSTMYVFLGFSFLAFIGNVFSFLYHRKIIAIIIAALSVGLVFYNYFSSYEGNEFTNLGMIGLMISGVMNYYETKIFNLMKNKSVILQSTITCPNCGHKKEETMPTDACQYFYECENCKAQLKPKQGDCCVYCSYGSVPCPPIQETGKSCCA